MEVPKSIGKVHYEVELAVVMGHRCKRIPEGEAMEAIAGYALALDMTARDLQVCWPVQYHAAGTSRRFLCASVKHAAWHTAAFHGDAREWRSDGQPESDAVVVVVVHEYRPLRRTPACPGPARKATTRSCP